MNCCQGLCVGGLRRMLTGPCLICGGKAQPSPVCRGDRVWCPSCGASQSLHLEIRIDKQPSSFLGNDVCFLGTSSIQECVGLWAKDIVISRAFLCAAENGHGRSSHLDGTLCVATAPAAYFVQSKCRSEAHGLHEQFSKTNWEEVCFNS